MSLRPLLVANYDFVLGGGEVGLQMLAEELLERGHRPLVAVPGTGSLAAHLERRRISTRHTAAVHDLRTLAGECDLVHAYSSGVILAAWQAQTGRPLVYHALIPNPDPRDAELTTIADAVLCNSKATARRFDGARNVRIVYNGVRPPRPARGWLPLRPGRRTVAIVGGTSVRKGQLDALPALLDVIRERDDVDVALVGRIAGPVGRQLLRAADGSDGRLRLFGFVPDVANHLGSFALVLVPSRSEGFGRVAVEALRAGVPVLATRVEGLIEALEGLDDPWLPADPAQWADRILAELDRPRHSPAELRAAAARFDPERFTDEVLDVYREIVTQSG
jgi:glycosyltransferase involved in cell wall biosynthesis